MYTDKRKGRCTVCPPLPERRLQTSRVERVSTSARKFVAGSAAAAVVSVVTGDSLID